MFEEILCKWWCIQHYHIGESKFMLRSKNKTELDTNFLSMVAMVITSNVLSARYVLVSVVWFRTISVDSLARSLSGLDAWKAFCQLGMWWWLSYARWVRRWLSYFRIWMYWEWRADPNIAVLKNILVFAHSDKKPLLFYFCLSFLVKVDEFFSSFMLGIHDIGSLLIVRFDSDVWFLVNILILYRIILLNYEFF